MVKVPKLVGRDEIIAAAKATGERIVIVAMDIHTPAAIIVKDGVYMNATCIDGEWIASDGEII